MDGEDGLPAAMKPSLRRRLATGSAWALVGRVTFLLTTIAVSAQVTRLLTPEGAGTFFLATSVVAAAAVVAELGLRPVAVRMIASSFAAGDPGRARAAIVRILGIGGVSSLVVGVTIGAAPGKALFAAMFGETNLAAVAGFVGALVAFRAFGVLRAEVFRGCQDFRTASAFDSGVDAQTLTVALLAALALATGWSSDIETVLLLHVVAWVPALAIGGRLLWRRTRQLTGEGTATSREVLTIAWPLWIQEAGILVLSQADLWIVAAVLGATDAAYYGAALRALAIVSFPLVIANSVLPPLISELYERRELPRLERMLRTTATVTGIPSLLIVGAFVVGGERLLSLIFGATYAAAWPALVLLSVGQFVNVWVGSCAMTLVMAGRERLVMVLSLSSAGLMVAMALLIAPHWGAPGVACAASTALAVKNIVAWQLARRLLGVRTHMGLRCSWTEVRTVVREANDRLRRGR